MIRPRHDGKLPTTSTDREREAMVSNKLRANRVVNIVSKYTGNDGVETQEDALADLLTDLRHYCHARNVDFLEALNMSATWYADDVYNPNLIDE